MAHKLAIFNMKGGVGKSTTTYNLAAGLVKFHQQRVLLIDIDPQGNSAASLGIQIWQLGPQLKDVLQRQSSIQETIVPTSSGVDVVPSNILLAEEEIPISGLPGRELLLRKAIAPIEKQYDFILIDCPPNVGVFAVNALMAAEKVIIPVDMSYLGLLGIQGIERALTLVREYLDHPIEVAGALATRYDGRNNLSKEVLASLTDHFGDRMFETLIPETVKLREAPSHGQSIFEYDPSGSGAKAYQSLVNEVMAL
ncbi:ParA family protein [Alkalinema sp. FACHB-956]|uniref:ParA family protein n=1 Tax=Alkalinema sp. FACHB-956 TaxID=2692768 RepID=UPI001684AB10|nr:ParA family protein [Alkalinema sp. FACHB-956]MBD2329685.1 ParA family protein [Alkalinema sp. FACHB-956]